jgi:hypothetical protein
MKYGYKEYFDVCSEEEIHEKWKELIARGYHGSEIYISCYWGNDGIYHRQVFVFED